MRTFIVLMFDKIIMKNNDNLVNATFTLNPPPNNRTVSVNLDVLFKKEIVKEQQRISILNSKDEEQKYLDHVVFSTSTDTCKLFNGNLGSFFGKVFMETFLDSALVDHHCPFRENHHLILKNWTFTENFLPPWHSLMRFKMEIGVFGTTKDKKGWQRLYFIEIFARFKK
jgi:Protein of unknown function (DUF1091)